MNHHLNHYIMSGLLTVMVGALAFGSARNIREVSLRTSHLDSAVSHIAPEKHSRLSWPDLTQEQTIALGEALKGKAPGTVVIYCASPNCSALRNDLDDAFQIADWKSDFEDREVESEGDAGIFVGPPSPDADALSQAIKVVTGLGVGVVQIDGIQGLGVIIGKRSQ